MAKVDGKPWVNYGVASLMQHVLFHGQGCGLWCTTFLCSCAPFHFLIFYFLDPFCLLYFVVFSFKNLGFFFFWGVLVFLTLDFAFENIPKN